MKQRASRVHGVDDIEDVETWNRTSRKGVRGVEEKGRSPGNDVAFVNCRLPKLGVSGGKNLLTDTLNCSTTNGDTITRKVSLCKSDLICRDGSSSNAQPMTHTDFGTAVRGPEQLHSPQNGAHDGQEAKSPIDTTQPSLGAPNGPAAASNGTFAQSSKVNQCLEE